MTIVLSPADAQFISETLEDDEGTDKDRSLRLAADIRDQIRIARARPRKDQRQRQRD